MHEVTLKNNHFSTLRPTDYKSTGMVARTRGAGDKDDGVIVASEYSPFIGGRVRG